MRSRVAGRGLKCWDTRQELEGKGGEDRDGVEDSV